MAAKMVNGPPHCGQVVRSIWNTRLSNWAQLIRACGEGVGAALSPSMGAGAGSASPGTI